MVDFKKQYEEAVKNKAVKQLTPQMFKFSEEDNLLVGVYVSQDVVGVGPGEEGYNQYVFETDDGLVKIGPGKGFDNDVAAQLAPGVIYAIEFLGKVSTNSGRTVNKYNVEEVGKAEYTETAPVKAPKSGKAIDAK